MKQRHYSIPKDNLYKKLSSISYNTTQINEAQINSIKGGANPDVHPNQKFVQT